MTRVPALTQCLRVLLFLSGDKSSLHMACIHAPQAKVAELNNKCLECVLEIMYRI